MKTSRYAWVTITGKVFLDDIDIADALEVKDKDENEERTHVEIMYEDYHTDRINTAFKDLANDKLHDLFPTDDPFKVVEITIEDSKRC